MEKAKKGDIVAIETTERTIYIGRPSEGRKEFRLAMVASASREGAVKSVKTMEYGTISQLKYMPYSPIVHRITGEAQAKARRLWERLSAGGAWDRDRFATQGDIKAAILSA